jgi:lysozyme family protein
LFDRHWDFGVSWKTHLKEIEIRKRTRRSIQRICRKQNKDETRNYKKHAQIPWWKVGKSEMRKQFGMYLREKKLIKSQ